MDIFAENPLAHEFELLNHSTRNLGIDTKILYPNKLTTLKQLQLKFCDFKRAYYKSSEIQEWFNNLWITFTVINGSGPIVCNGLCTGGSGSGIADRNQTQITFTNKTLSNTEITLNANGLTWIVDGDLANIGASISEFEDTERIEVLSNGRTIEKTLEIEWVSSSSLRIKRDYYGGETLTVFS